MASELYDIRTKEGKLFCKCQDNEEDVRLIGKNCSMSIQELIRKAYAPMYRCSRNQRRWKENKGDMQN